MNPATLLCEQCGYVVEGLDERGACPECGKPIAESVPERRTGVPIEPDADGKVNWWRAAWAVLWRPGETFERVRIDQAASRRFRHRADLAVFLSLASLDFVVHVFWSGWVVFIDRTQGVDGVFMFMMSIPRTLACSCMVAGLPCVLLWSIRFIERRGLRLIARGHGWRIDHRRASVVVDYAAAGWYIGLTLPIVLVVSVRMLWPLYMPMLYSAGPGLGPWLASLHYIGPGWYPFASLLLASPALIVPLFLFELLCYIGIRRCKFANQPRIRSAVPGAGGSTSVPPASE